MLLRNYFNLSSGTHIQPVILNPVLSVMNCKIYYILHSSRTQAILIMIIIIFTTESNLNNNPLLQHGHSISLAREGALL